MFRHIAVFTIGLVAIANLNAGYIQIGGNTGLTATNSNGTITTTGAAENQYINTALQGVSSVTETGSGVLCAGTTASTCTPTTGFPSGETGNEFATADGVTFSMLNGDTSAANCTGANPVAGCNVWAMPGTGTNTITIPIGIFGVSNVYTMLNDEYGVGTNTPTQVTFNFSNSALDETFTLVNGTVISDSFDCTGGTGLATCQSFNYNTGLNTADVFSTTGANLGVTSGGPNVSAFNVWTGTYSGGTGNYANTNGTINLDAQDFYLGSAATGSTLLNIVIQDTQGGATRVSRDYLSAVTVLVSPEPSTVFLFMAGVGAIAFMRRRAKQA